MRKLKKRHIPLVLFLSLVWSGLPQQASLQNVARAQAGGTVNEVSLYLRAAWKHVQGKTRPWRDVERIGSADRLIGNVYSLAIFISTPQNSWNHQDKLKIFQKQKEAESWMVAQAKRYGIRVAFQNGTYGLNKQDISVPNIPSYDRGSNEKYKYWVSYLLKLIGYKSPLDLWSWVQKNTNCTNLHIIIYANKTGISYATPFKQGIDANSFFIEGSILYRYYPSGVELYPASIAHETLHLYDAWDLYNSADQTRDVASKSRQLFPNDIMYRTSANLAQQQVDALTAWRIGWNSKKEPWYDWFKPSYQR